jgi:plastocyanin
LYVTNYGNESNDGQGQVLRVIPGTQAVAGPSVSAPDESKSYALAQPTPVGQASTSTEVGGSVDIVEPTDPQQWGFSPKSITVQVGQAVKFTNTGKISHTATQSQGAFDTGFLKNNESATLTFDTPGTYTYFCQPHPWMQGTIIVEGQAKSSVAAAAVASTADENAPPPTIGFGRAAVFVGVIIALVFAFAFAATRSKRRGNIRN